MWKRKGSQGEKNHTLDTTQLCLPGELGEKPGKQTLNDALH